LLDKLFVHAALSAAATHPAALGPAACEFLLHHAQPLSAPLLALVRAGAAEIPVVGEALLARFPALLPRSRGVLALAGVVVEGYSGGCPFLSAPFLGWWRRVQTLANICTDVARGPGEGQRRTT
jgi:hypothetical protein